jgi:hypothetical protein
MTDFVTQSGTAHTNNWLKNGNFYRIPRDLQARSYSSPYVSEVRPKSSVVELITPVDTSKTIGTTPERIFIANWSVSGSEENAASLDIDPINSRTGIRHRSYDSGHLVRISFFKAATITFEQEIDVVNQFRGMPATAAFSAYRIDGEVKIETEIDFGSEVMAGVPYFSSRVGPYRRITQEVSECPLNLTKIVLRLKFSGVRGNSIGVSGVAFALGAYEAALPYSEAVADFVLPRGAIILWLGDSCPPGFREVEMEGGGFLYQTYGDPNVLNGGTQEYPDLKQLVMTADPNNPPNSYDDALAARTPTKKEILGDNEHSAHQKTSLFGDAAETFLSQGPDSVRRMATVDFNDCGEPETGFTTDPNTLVRKQSIKAGESNGVLFDQGVPKIDNTSDVRQIASFKRQTVQNQVLPGGANEESDPNSPPSGGDVWRDPHKHTFKSKHVATLPPYFVTRFCEKI